MERTILFTHKIIFDIAAYSKTWALHLRMTLCVKQATQLMSKPINVFLQSLYPTALTHCHIIRTDTHTGISFMLKKLLVSNYTIFLVDIFINSIIRVLVILKINNEFDKTVVRIVLANCNRKRPPLQFNISI